MASLSSADKVLIFRSELLPYSETFIPSQAEKFESFTPYYAGLRRVPGLTTPTERTIEPTSSRLVFKARELGAISGRVNTALLRQAEELGPQLVHAHFEEGGLKALPLAERLKIPLVTTCHGYDVTIQKRKWQRWPGLGAYYQKRTAVLLEKGALFLGISRFICDCMIARGYPAEKILLHYIGVDTGLFQPDPTLLRQPVVLHVGRLVEKKGCADLIKAMVPVTRLHPEAELVVIGDGPLRADLEKLARDERVNARFLGSQKPEVVQRWMKECFLFCLPSRRGHSGDSEGLGIVNLEAQAVGTPVVGTRHGGIPEAVEHGVTGLLSGERDPAGLAENIVQLFQDSGLRARMGSAARARMVEQFDLQTQSRRLEQIYRDTLRNR